ncbi:hypothetical protein [Rhizobium sp. YTU87027]|uniref:hypothetical protein n=1 Tax=Rhizobium sp. YTU87027 TaxID=3417741 RepID=UPI003D69B5D7
MSTTDASFPRREFTRARGPIYFALFGGGVISLYLIAKGAAAISGSRFGPVAGILAAAALLAIYVTGALKLLSRVDFSKVTLAMDHEGIHLAHQAETSIPWTSIAKIRYYEVGRFHETKIILIERLDIGKREVRIDAHLLHCGNPRDLYETMKRYHRYFAPMSESEENGNALVYGSSSWTGLDDD